MEAFQAVLGFVFGAILFFVILSKLRFLFISYGVIILFFFISLCLGMILAKLLSWLIIILIVVCVGIWIYMKLFSNPSSSSENSTGSTGNEANETQTAEDSEAETK